MKRGTLPNLGEPTVRILLVSPHTYQISFRNIYGYLRTVLFDRCKKVGAQYLYYEKSYVIHSQKLVDLKKEFEELLQMNTNDSKMKFKIEDFPMTNIKMILKSEKKTDSKDKTKSRIIFVDKSSIYRYFYLKKRIDDFYCFKMKSSQEKKQRKITFILTSQINRRFWMNNILQPQKCQIQQKSHKIPKKQFPKVTQLTYSELSSKKLSNFHNSDSQFNKIYLITYDNLKFIQNSWVLAEIQLVSCLIIDDAQSLVNCESQLATLENKKRNFEFFKILLRNYPIDSELLLFLSKLPDPNDIHKLLVLTKPKNFSGIKFSTTLNLCIFNESLFTPEQKTMYEEFSSWFRKRYRNQNKSSKQIFYLLKNVVVKILDETVFKRTLSLLPNIQLQCKYYNTVKVNLIQSSADIVQKFRLMDRKFKKVCPSINFKQILEDFHDNFKSSERKFQVTNKIDDHLMNKNQKLYFFQAKQLMLNSKFQLILKKLLFCINFQKERICVVLQDQKLQKRLKKYFKQTQVQYIDYELPKGNTKIYSENLSKFENNLNTYKMSYSQFDSNFSIKVCVINLNRLHRQHIEIVRKNKNLLKKQSLLKEFKFEYDRGREKIQEEIIVPKLTTVQSVHFIDSFWNEFNTQKEKLLESIFDFQLSYIEQHHQDKTIQFNQIFRQNEIIENYYLFQGSHEKVMLEKYLRRKQTLCAIKQYEDPLRNQHETLIQFIDTLLIDEKLKYSKCENIDYLDIDDQFDKIEEQAKRLKNDKQNYYMEEKVFLPKFTKPDCKSFKELLEEKLLQKNIGEILQGEEKFQEFQGTKEKKQKEIKIVQQDLLPLFGQQTLLSQDKKSQANKEENQNIEEINKKLQKQQPQNPICNFQEPLSNICPSQLMFQTIRLQPSTVLRILPQGQQKLTQKSQDDRQYKEMDLFDQLLGNQFLDKNQSIGDQIWNKNLENVKCNHNQLEQVETETQFDERNDELGQFGGKLGKWTTDYHQKQHQLQQQAQDELMLNFGFMAYHNLQSQLNNNIKSQNLSNYKQSYNKISHGQCKQSADNSIEIIQTTPKINRNKSKSQILYKRSKLNNFKQTKMIVNKTINPKIMLKQRFPCYQLPKQKKLCNKKLYQEAITKSKQLWQKKLRKQKQLLIIKSTPLLMDIKPKIGWKLQLTQHEKDILKNKGIQI